MKYQLDNSPTINGFSAGVSLKDTTVWIGRANYADQYIPGRVQIEAPTGVYVAFGGAERYVTTDLEYLVVPQGCSCSWMDPSVATLSPGLVYNPDVNYHFVTGRKTFSSGKIAISKTSKLDFTEWYNDENDNEPSDTATEVLVCESTTVSSTAKPTVTYANAGCAGWKMYKMDNAPITNGFKVAGLSRSLSDIYIGRAWLGGEFMPGRIEIGNGLFVSLYGEWTVTTDVEYLILPIGCACNWLAPSVAVNKVGLVKTADPIRHYAVGIKTLPTGQIAITKVVIPSFEQAYIDQNGNEQYDSAPENLLVCEHS